MNLKKHGKEPFSVAVIHGGPGAAGEMAPVARELAKDYGVLEPFQTAQSINGQIDELKEVLEKRGNLPVTLIGHSWGAWLVYIFAAQHPSLVKKIILVGSGPFVEKYAANLMEARLKRLSLKDNRKANFLMEKLTDISDHTINKDEVMCEFGELMSKADSYKSIQRDRDKVVCSYEIYQSVWSEAAKLRASRKLLNLGKQIKCPVIAIHGDYDSHPAKGVSEPLSVIVKNFKITILKNCGHYPWYEHEAKEEFFFIVKEELK